MTLGCRYGGFLSAIKGVVFTIFYCSLKQLTDFADTEHELTQDQDIIHHGTEPVLPGKESSLCSAEDLFSDKMCKICYDAPRVASSYLVAIALLVLHVKGEENKACPICRRLIPKSQRAGERRALI
ncbi:hypothetical protein ACP70R_041498 [Stipagrostis hirtigluma subsp. patula]